MRAFRGIVLSIGLVVCATGPVIAAADSAGSFPDKPVRFICPFPPGGDVDFVTRALAGKLGEFWGQQAIVENRGGEGGTIGAAVVAKAPADRRNVSGTCCAVWCLLDQELRQGDRSREGPPGSSQFLISMGRSPAKSHTKLSHRTSTQALNNFRSRSPAPSETRKTSGSSRRAARLSNAPGSSSVVSSQSRKGCLGNRITSRRLTVQQGWECLTFGAMGPWMVPVAGVGRIRRTRGKFASVKYSGSGKAKARSRETADLRI